MTRVALAAIVGAHGIRGELRLKLFTDSAAAIAAHPRLFVGGEERALASIKDKFKGETLRVTCWSGPYATDFEKVFVPEFEAITGANVEVIPSWIEIPA